MSFILGKMGIGAILWEVCTMEALRRCCVSGIDAVDGCYRVTPMILGE